MATKYDGDPEESRALDLQIKLFRARNALGNKLEQFWNDRDLTESQFATLEALHHLGPLNHKEIAEKSLKREANITHVVDNLERDGLVRRERSEEDRRVVIVHLTDQGAEKISQVFPEFVEYLTDLLDGFPAEKQERLAELAKQLGVHLME